MLLPDRTECLSQTDEGATLRFELSPALLWFKGHFPDQPVLPGVAQLHWVNHFARELLGLDGIFNGLQSVKFIQPAVPRQTLRLELVWSAAKNQLRFTFRLDSHAPEQTVVSSGKIQFSLPDSIGQEQYEQS